MGRFYFTLSAFRVESIKHEYFHHVIHPLIPKYSQIILNHTVAYLGVDNSYYLNDDIKGTLNAFEEYIVRKLTNDVLNMKFPLNIDEYIKENL